MNYRKIPLGRYIKVMKNPSMSYKEMADTMYTDVVTAFMEDWVQYTLGLIHERSIYIVHSPLDKCYCNRFVESYSSDKEMEKEMKVKPLTFLGVL